MWSEKGSCELLPYPFPLFLFKKYGRVHLQEIARKYKIYIRNKMKHPVVKKRIVSANLILGDRVSLFCSAS